MQPTLLLSVEPTQWLSAVMPSLMHFYAAYPSSFCKAYSMALCSDTFPYAFLRSLFFFFSATYSMALCNDAFPYALLRSLPFFFLCSLLNSFLYAFPYAFLRSLLSSVAYSQLLYEQTSL
jgi:hypothetical protein